MVVRVRVEENGGLRRARDEISLIDVKLGPELSCWSVMTAEVLAGRDVDSVCA